MIWSSGWAYNAMIFAANFFDTQTAKLLILMWQDNNYGQNTQIVFFFLSLYLVGLIAFISTTYKTSRQHRFTSMITIISHVENACIEFMHRSRFCQFETIALHCWNAWQAQQQQKRKKSHTFKLKNRRKCAANFKRKKNRLIAMELMKRDRNEIMQTCKHEGMLICWYTVEIACICRSFCFVLIFAWLFVRWHFIICLFVFFVCCWFCGRVWAKRKQNEKRKNRQNYR